MVAFRDLDKKAGDVIRVGYCHDKPWQVAINHSGDNPKFSAMGSVTAANILDATPTIRYAVNGLTMEAKAGSTGGAAVDMKYEFPKACTAKDITCPALPLFSGLTLGTRFERRMIKSVPSDTTEVSAEYKKDLFQSRVNFNPYSFGWGLSNCFTFDKLPGKGTLMFGGELNGGGKDLSALNYTFGAAYNRMVAKPWAVALKAAPHDKMPIGKLTGSFFAATEKGHALAAEVQHTISDKSTNVTLGGLVYLSPKKETWMKGKILPNAQIATVLCHKFSDNLTGSFGCQFSGTGQASEPVSYGMKLALTC